MKIGIVLDSLTSRNENGYREIIWEPLAALKRDSKVRVGTVVTVRDDTGMEFSATIDRLGSGGGTFTFDTAAYFLENLHEEKANEGRRKNAQSSFLIAKLRCENGLVLLCGYTVHIP